MVIWWYVNKSTQVLVHQMMRFPSSSDRPTKQPDVGIKPVQSRPGTGQNHVQCGYCAKSVFFRSPNGWCSTKTMTWYLWVDWYLMLHPYTTKHDQKGSILSTCDNLVGLNCLAIPKSRSNVIHLERKSLKCSIKPQPKRGYLGSNALVCDKKMTVSWSFIVDRSRYPELIHKPAIFLLYFFACVDESSSYLSNIASIPNPNLACWNQMDGCVSNSCMTVIQIRVCCWVSPRFDQSPVIPGQPSKTGI